MTGSTTLIQFLRFAGVGAVGTAAHYVVLITLVELGGVPPVAGSIAGFVTGALVNYALARRVVFDTTRSHGASLPKFLTVAVVGLMLNSAAMTVLVVWMALPYLPAQVLVTAGLLVWHYGANRLWTFSR